MKNIFISYSHKDEDWKNRLVTHLRELERSGYFKLWHDREIPLGNQWPKEIKNALDTADVAILMISPDFLDSDFIRNKEMPRIKERKEEEKVTVIPLFARPANWKMIPWLAELQGVPKDAAPLSKMHESDIDEVLVELTQKLLTLVSMGTDVSTGAGSPGRGRLGATD